MRVASVPSPKQTFTYRDFWVTLGSILTAVASALVIIDILAKHVSFSLH